METAAWVRARQALRWARLVCGVVAILGGLAESAFGAAATWVGNTDANWATVANWSGNQPTGNTPTFGAAGTSGTTLNNNLTAGTVIAGMTFNAGAAAFTINGNAITLSNNITLTTGGSAQIINLPMALNLTRTMTSNDNSLTLGGKISGAGGLTVSNTTGIVAMNNAGNDFSGQVTIARGTMSFNSIADTGEASALGENGVIIAGSSGSSTLQYTGAATSSNRQIEIVFNTTIDANGSGGLTFTNATFNPASAATTGRTLTLAGTYAGTNEIQGAIQDNTSQIVNLIIGRTGANSATWKLSGTSTYTGTTSITGGTALINGNFSGATGNVTVTNGTLGGTGTVGGNTAINAGGILSPGTSPGTLDFAGNLALNNGSTLVFEGGDLVAVTGELDLNNNWTLQLESVDSWQIGGSTTLFSFGTLAALPDLVPTFVDNTGLGGVLSLVQVGNSIVLNGYSQFQIPEPASVALLALAGLAAWRRRR